MEKLLEKIEKTETCWNWRGYISEKGYGVVSFKGRSYQAHRLVYEILVGKVPKELVMDHLCRNRSCVNPKHLEPVPTQINIARGEGISAINTRKNTCKWGHEFTKQNTIYRMNPKNGTKTWRSCKTCAKRILKEARARGFCQTRK